MTSNKPTNRSRRSRSILGAGVSLTAAAAVGAMMMASPAWAGKSHKSSSSRVKQVAAAAQQLATHSYISGTVTYRERMMPPPGSSLTVKLIDVSMADAPSTTLAETTYALGKRGVPYGYRLGVKTSDFQPNHSYAVRATINAPDGSLLWTSDTVNPVDASRKLQQLPQIVLVRSSGSGSAGNSASTAAPVLTGEWKVTSIDGRPVAKQANGKPINPRAVATINFGSDGVISGSTGCNRFTGQYTAAGDALTISPLGSTRMACIPMLSDQEARYLGFFEKPPITYGFNSAGSLTITNGAGKKMVAVR